MNWKCLLGRHKWQLVSQDRLDDLNLKHNANKDPGGSIYRMYLRIIEIDTMIGNDFKYCKICGKTKEKGILCDWKTRKDMYYGKTDEEWVDKI